MGYYDDERMMSPDGRRLMSLGQSLAHGKRKHQRSQMKLQAQLQNQAAIEAEKRGQGNMSMFQREQLKLQSGGQDLQKKMLQMNIDATKAGQLRQIGATQTGQAVGIKAAAEEAAKGRTFQRPMMEANVAASQQATKHAASMSPLQQAGMQTQTAQTAAGTRGLEQQQGEFEMMQPYRLNEAKRNAEAGGMDLERLREQRNIQKRGYEKKTQEDILGTGQRIGNLAKKYDMGKDEVRERLYGKSFDWRKFGGEVKSGKVFRDMLPIVGSKVGLDRYRPENVTDRFVSKAGRLDPYADIGMARQLRKARQKRKKERRG